MTPDTTGPHNARAPWFAAAYTPETPAEQLGDARDAGLVEGARIVTARGLRPVQCLRPGDLVITRGHGVAPVLRVEQYSLVARAIYVIAGSIGHRQTERDSLLPAGQPVLVRDWRARAFSRRPEFITRADRLVDGEYVRDIGLQPMTLYRLHCGQPRVLYADGMELGSADWLTGTVESG